MREHLLTNLPGLSDPATLRVIGRDLHRLFGRHLAVLGLLPLSWRLSRHLMAIIAN
jgi:hypothetical protein